MYAPDNKKDKIEDVKEALYSRSSDGVFVKKRHALKNSATDEGVPLAWHEEESSEAGYHFG